ncbi:unnamed protein product [Brachionus calyciflorus]|uniref:H15 domain-containing protein n=1 Tax=Brachionus calyciflorus TaxID=104777 RepID=A0A813QCI4_9BILA|nr:unnamed protein product [Brachionus calyciflorus]
MSQSLTQVKKVVKKTTVQKSSNKPSHPKFIDMIVEALKSLNERSGSSRQALLKFIISKYQLDEKVANVHVKLCLKNGVKNGSLKQLKGVGSNGSFKVGDAIKSKKSDAKKQVVKDASVTKTVEDKPKKNVKKIVRPKAPKANEAESKEIKLSVAKKNVKSESKAKDQATKVSKTQTKTKIVKVVKSTRNVSTKKTVVKKN